MKSRWTYLVLIGLSVALVDQGTKYLAVEHLTPGFSQAGVSDQGFSDRLGAFYREVRGPCSGVLAGCPTVEVVDGFWNWHYVENRGAAWGLLAGASEQVRVPFFLLVSLAAFGFIVAVFRKLPDDQRLFVVSLSLVFGGAIGNFIDRLHLSYVIDFIDWHLGANHWPTFNFADSAITTGVLLMFAQWVREWAQARAAARSGTRPESSVDQAG